MSNVHGCGQLAAGLILPGTVCLDWLRQRFLRMIHKCLWPCICVLQPLFLRLNKTDTNLNSIICLQVCDSTVMPTKPVAV